MRSLAVVCLLFWLAGCTGTPVRSSNPQFIVGDGLGYPVREIAADLRRTKTNGATYRIEATLLSRALMNARARDLSARSLVQQPPIVRKGICFELEYFTDHEGFGRFRDSIVVAEDINGNSFPISFLADEQGSDPKPSFVNSPFDGFHWVTRGVGCTAAEQDIHEGVALHFTPKLNGWPRSTLVWRVNQPTIRRIPPIDN